MLGRLVCSEEMQGSTENSTDEMRKFRERGFRSNLIVELRWSFLSSKDEFLLPLYKMLSSHQNK